MVWAEDEFLNVTCCGETCQIVADKVDVYYWPDPGANTSCLSIVGNEVSYVADGATTDDLGHVYWGCTVYGTSLGIMADQTTSFVETASLTSVAGISYKAYVFNPWDPSQCGNQSASLASGRNSTLQPRDVAPSINRRGHSLIITNSDVSTTVSGNYTFTSPSIYVNFQGLHAGDDCGSTFISSTMIAFSPGELSTITGPIGNWWAKPQPFNPKDLPCPPYSIMSQNWYTPEPGIPYRPYFAFPAKLRSIPDFQYCNAFYFSVFDPPITLGPATVMVPVVTTLDPSLPSIAPRPVSTVHGPAQATDPPGAPPAIASQRPSPEPAAKPSGDPPSKTGIGFGASHASDPIEGSNVQSLVMAPEDPPPKSTQSLPPPTPGDPASNTAGDSHQGGSLGANVPIVNNGPRASSLVAAPPAANQGPWNPNDESAGQMSALYQALGPASPANPQAQSVPNAVANPESSDPDANSDGHSSQPGSGDPQDSDSSTFNSDSNFGSPQPGGDSQNFSPGSENSASQDGVQAPDTAQSDEGSIRPDSGRSLGPNEGTTPTTIQLGPQQAPNPTTINIGDQRAGGSGNPESGGNPDDGSDTKPPMTAAAFPRVTVAGNTLTLTDPSSVLIAGTISTPGGAAATIAGTPVSLASGGNLIIGATASAASPPSIFTVGGQVFTANPTAFAIAGVTLSAGASAVVVSGTPVSLGPSGDLVIGGTTQTMPDMPQQSIFTAGGQIFTANPSAFAIAGTTLSAGGPGTTISGTPVSLDAAGSLIIGTSTVPLNPSLPTASVITTDGQVVTVGGDGQVAVDGATLTSGGMGITIGGIPMSVGSDGLVMGNNTVSLPAFSGSGAITSNSINEYVASSTSSIVGDKTGTGKPQKGAASYGARMPTVIPWAFLVVTTVMCLR